jgi:MFS family permease
MALALAEPGRAGRRLGQLQSAGAVGAGLGLLVALGLTWVKVPIRPMYYVAGVAAMLAALSCLCIPRNIKTPGPRFVFRKRYGLYYALQFLDGWRKQIFIAFAGYNLVHEHGASLTTMLVLAMVTTGINWFSGPIIGWIVDHVGERRTLVAYFAALVPVCLGYALVGDARVLYAIFVLDNVLFPLGGMAQTTYVNRIAPPSEHTATLSMGVASNHVASVIMPLVGGLLWAKLGSQWVFLVGAVTAAASITAAMAVPRRSHPVAAVAQAAGAV